MHPIMKLPDSIQRDMILHLNTMQYRVSQEPEVWCNHIFLSQVMEKRDYEVWKWHHRGLRQSVSNRHRGLEEIRG